MLLGSLTPEINDREYLASQRVRVALQGHQPFMASVQATHATLQALRDGVAVVVAADPRGERLTDDGWKTLDDFVYGIGE